MLGRNGESEGSWRGKFREGGQRQPPGENRYKREVARDIVPGSYWEPWKGFSFHHVRTL
jgi:hypothetical protein